MLGFYPMMRPVEPGFQIPEDSVDVREPLVGSLWRSDDSNVVDIVFKRRIRVPQPPVRSHPTAELDVTSQKCPEALRAGIGDRREPEPASALSPGPLVISIHQNLDRSDHHALVLSCTNSAASLAFCWAADKSLIDLNEARQLRTPIVDHPFA